MQKLAALTTLAFTFLTCLLVLPAFAQGARTWLSSSGDDTNTCSFALPCATFSGAFGKTSIGGEITCIDHGNFGGITIDKSITINCDNGSNSASLNNIGVFKVTVAAATDRVILRGIDLDLVQASTSGISGISFSGAGTLVLDRMKITNNHSTGGIFFNPNGTGKLIVTDSIIADTGGGGTGAGILVKPQAGGTAQVMLEHVNVSANTFGIAADGSASTGGINMSIINSVMSGNSQDGIVATTSAGGAPIGVYLKNTQSINNSIGIRSIGSNVTVRVDGSSVIGNGTGLSFSGGGALLSAGNNTVQANGTNGAFSGSYGLE